MRRQMLLATLAVLVGCGPKTSTIPTFTPSELTAQIRADEQQRLAAEPGMTATLRLLETTDLHVNMEAFDYYRNTPTLDSGLVRTATLIRRARAETANSVLIDNGDILQGSPLGDWFHSQRNPRQDIHTVYKAMNLLGYDAANLGNHEFNYGLDFLEASLQGANFPYVSANVLRDDDAHAPYIAPYVILKRTLLTDDGQTDEVRIGVIGFTPPQVMNWDRTNLLGRVNVADIVDTAAALVPRLRAEGADIVIAVPHSGISALPRAGRDENAVYYLAGVPGIDAILCGHSHQVFPSKTYENVPDTDLAQGTVRGVPTVMAGFWGSHLGVVDLQLKKTSEGWRVVGGKAEAREAKTLLAPTDFEADLRNAIASDHEATLTYLQQQVGIAAQPIHSYFSQIMPTTSVQLVQEAQLWYARKAIDEGGATTAALKDLPLLSASAPLKAGAKADDYTDVAAGPLTLRNVADLYIYPNTVKVVKVTGSQVLDWLEMAAGMFNRIDPTASGEQTLLNPDFRGYNFDQLLGVDYSVDATQPSRFDKSGAVVDEAAHRIFGLTYNGAPVMPEQEFLVVTNNYRANGGGSFAKLDGTQVVLDPGSENREVLRDYVEAVGTVGTTLAAGWRLKPVPAATVVLRSSARAQDKLADAHGLLTYLGDDVDGFARYKLNW